MINSELESETGKSEAVSDGLIKEVSNGQYQEQIRLIQPPVKDNIKSMESLIKEEDLEASQQIKDKPGYTESPVMEEKTPKSDEPDESVIIGNPDAIDVLVNKKYTLSAYKPSNLV